MPTLPSDLNTYSAAIDHVAYRSGRWDKKTDIAGYLRATMRELQVLSQFAHDLVEDQLTPTADPYIWTKPNNLRQMLAVSYPHIVDPQGRPMTPEYIPPSKKLVKSQVAYYYYDGPTYFTFAGAGDNSSITPYINIAYSAYFLPYSYYATMANRPATYGFNETTEVFEWDYKSASTDTEKETARDKVTNWLLFNWFDLCVEGTLAKLFKAYKDERKAETFALYKSMQKDLRVAEHRGSIAAYAG